MTQNRVTSIRRTDVKNKPVQPVLVRRNKASRSEAGPNYVAVKLKR
ncbi:hypothetical protein [Caldalkalibacillus salinus]|nr:hypothetical protein [Caldalkalibacillus salinus]